MSDILSIIKSILSSPAGSFAVVFGFMFLAGWLVYFVTKKTTAICMKHDIISDSHKQHGTYLDDIRKDMAFIKGTINVIISGAQPAVQSHSPVSLTEIGKNIYNELEVLDKVEKNWDKIVAVLDEKVSNRNAYDIQKYCMETAIVEPEKFFDETTLNEIKNYAFYKGNPIAYYAGVFGVVIRDKYLEYKNISIDEIDKNDPNL